jgi:uncharacterized protein (DUF952 family)
VNVSAARVPNPRLHCAIVPCSAAVTRLILHITTQPEWEKAQTAGEHRAPSLDDEGFIHCSLPTQVTHVADWFYRDVPDLVLLAIDPAALGAESPLRWEPSADEFAGDFPHVYGPIPVRAVLLVVPWSRAEDGFELPEEIRHRLDG